MLIHLPKCVPSLATMLEDLGNPKPAEVAKALGVTSRTVSRWLAIGTAPRPAMLALFWITRWGQSQVDADTFNNGQMHAQMARALTDEVAELKCLLGKVDQIGDFGSANDPARLAVSSRDEFAKPQPPAEAAGAPSGTAEPPPLGLPLRPVRTGNPVQPTGKTSQLPQENRSLRHG